MGLSNTGYLATSLIACTELVQQFVSCTWASYLLISSSPALTLIPQGGLSFATGCDSWEWSEVGARSKEVDYALLTTTSNIREGEIDERIKGVLCLIALLPAL